MLAQMCGCLDKIQSSAARSPQEFVGVQRNETGCSSEGVSTLRKLASTPVSPDADAILLLECWICWET